MTEFYIYSALLALVAIVFVLLPLVYFNARLGVNRDQSNIDIYKERLDELEKDFHNHQIDEKMFEILKLELEKSLLSDVDEEILQEEIPEPSSGARSILIVAAFLVPLLSFYLYTNLGAIKAVDFAKEVRIAEQTFATATPENPESLRKLAVTLESRMRDEPENLDGWYLLGRTYMSLGLYEKGVDAIAKVMGLLEQDGEDYNNILGQYTQALFYAAKGQVTDQVKEMALKTFNAKPNDTIALEILGREAFFQRDFGKAIDFLQRSLRGAQGQRADFIRQGINAARAELGSINDQPATPALAGNQVISDKTNLRVLVELSPKFKADPEQTVFVFAKAVGGSPMPLAVQKVKASDLPTLINLDDTMAMVSDQNLSSASVVQITARLSQTGGVVSQPGDYQGISNTIELSNDNPVIKVMIDQVVGQFNGAQTVANADVAKADSIPPEVTVKDNPVAVAATDNGISLTIDVALAPQFQADPNQIVFVFARAINGPPMPAAVQRLSVKDLPARITLTDAQAMTPQLKLSLLDQVEIVARIANSGGPIAQAGDLEGKVGPIDVKQAKSPIAVKINTLIR